MNREAKSFIIATVAWMGYDVTQDKIVIYIYHIILEPTFDCQQPNISSGDGRRRIIIKYEKCYGTYVPFKS
jgi:hypothetical protein